MTAHIDIGATGSLYNYDSYLISCEEIPFIERNRDFTPIISNLKFSVSSSSPNTPAKGHDVRITVDSKVVFGGVLSIVTYNYDTRAYDCEAKSTLDLLRSENITPENVHSRIVTTDKLKYNSTDSTTYTGDSVDLHYVTLPHLMQCLFDHVGLTLTTTDADNAFYYFDETTTFQFKRLVFDEKSLYLFTTSSSDDPLSYNDLTEIYKYRDTLSYWDLISEICSICALTLVNDSVTDIRAYSLKALSTFASNKFQISSGNQYTVSNSDKYDYKVKTIAAEEGEISAVTRIDIWDNGGTELISDPAYTRLPAYFGLGGAPHYINKDVDIAYEYKPDETTHREDNVTRPWEQFIIYGAIQTGSYGAEYLTTDYTTGGRTWLPKAKLSGSYSVSPLLTKTYPKLFDFERIEMTVPATTDIKNCLTHYIDLEEQTSKITYEYQP